MNTVDSDTLIDMLDYEFEIRENRQARYDAGFSAGIEEGENRIAKLVDALIKDGKQAEIQTALNDESKRNEFYKIYGVI